MWVWRPLMYVHSAIGRENCSVRSSRGHVRNLALNLTSFDEQKGVCFLCRHHADATTFTLTLSTAVTASSSCRRFIFCATVAKIIAETGFVVLVAAAGKQVAIFRYNESAICNSQ